MQPSIATPAELGATDLTARTKRHSVSWTTGVLVLGATSILIGVLWDISWHQTIGRDTFWTPAHLAIYLGGSVGGLVCGWLAIAITYFRPASERAACVRLWGGYAPYGAWITIWGAVAMIMSAPFDDWWHNAYGLDVKIISPPHVVLFVGMYAVVIGALLLTLREQNARAAGAGHLFVYVAGVMAGLIAILFTDTTWPQLQHSSSFALTSALIFPVILVAASRASHLTWAATRVAAVYMLLRGAMVWILPLFAARPMLGPIYTPIDHMVPPSFPLWLIVPAVAIDLILRRAGFGRSWTRDAFLAAVLGVVFVALLLPVQWYFSRYLMSPAGNNWFFAGDRTWSYSSFPGERRFIFWGDEDGLKLASLIPTMLGAMISSAAGMAWGHWMTKVKR